MEISSDETDNRNDKPVTVEKILDLNVVVDCSHLSAFGLNDKSVERSLNILINPP